MQIPTMVYDLYRSMRTDEDGAIGWLTLGIIIGAILVVVLLIKLLIPGD